MARSIAGLPRWGTISTSSSRWTMPPARFIRLFCLVEEEGTMSSFLGLREMIAVHGLFGSLYTDRGGHYFITREGESKVDKNELTQVGRALASSSALATSHPIRRRGADE